MCMPRSTNAGAACFALSLKLIWSTGRRSVTFAKKYPGGKEEGRTIGNKGNKSQSLFSSPCSRREMCLPSIKYDHSCFSHKSLTTSKRLTTVCFVSYQNGGINVRKHLNRSSRLIFFTFRTSEKPASLKCLLTVAPSTESWATTVPPTCCINIRSVSLTTNSSCTGCT